MCQRMPSSASRGLVRLSGGDGVGARSPHGLALVETIAAAGHHLHHKQS